MIKLSSRRSDRTYTYTPRLELVAFVNENVGEKCETIPSEFLLVQVLTLVLVPLFDQVNC